MTVKRELADVKREVDHQLSKIYKLEALGQNDAKAQLRLEVLLRLLEAAQQRHRNMLQDSEDRG